jgi:hypothetical protein
MTNKEVEDKQETLVMPGEAARALRVTTKTLQRMAQRNELSSVLLPSGHRRYIRVEIDALADSHTSSDPSPLGSDETSGAPTPVETTSAGAVPPAAPAGDSSDLGDAA